MASYGQAVTFNAHLANTADNPPISTVTVYTQRVGSTTKTKITGRPVNANGNIGGTADFTRDTTLYAIHSADNVAATATKTVNVYAKMTAAIGGHYGTKSGLRLYHHTARRDPRLRLPRSRRASASSSRCRSTSRRRGASPPPAVPRSTARARRAAPCPPASTPSASPTASAPETPSGFELRNRCSATYAWTWLHGLRNWPDR
jgi:hypothetical protein